MTLLHLKRLCFGRDARWLSFAVVGFLRTRLKPIVLVADRVPLSCIRKKLLHFFGFEDVELRVSTLVHVQVVPVLWRVASERVVEVLTLCKVPVQLQPLCFENLVVLFITEEAPAFTVK